MSLEQLKGLALAWGPGGGGNLIKDPCFYILKIWKRSVEGFLNSFCLVAGGSRDMKQEKMTRHIDFKAWQREAPQYML